MTREEARKAAEVMLAYANGAEIERYNNLKSEWEETNCTFDWFTYDYRVKLKRKFDPKTLNPFDKVLVRNKRGYWECGLFSHINNKVCDYKYVCTGSDYCYCIPYNEDTKHLIGTSDDAPEYYKYWEE